MKQISHIFKHKMNSARALLTTTKKITHILIHRKSLLILTKQNTHIHIQTNERKNSLHAKINQSAKKLNKIVLIRYKKFV